MSLGRGYVLALTGAMLALTGALVIDAAIRWAEAGTRISRRCVGDTALYHGSVRGEGVLALNPYDRACITEPEPEYPGDSSPFPTSSSKER